MANRFDNQRGTAPIVDSIKNEKAKVKYSEVDLTSKISFDCGLGWIVPFDLIETLPDSDYELSYDMVAISRNPLTRRLLSGMSVYIHTYAEDLKDMWEGFPRFITKGRSGTFNGQIPLTKNVYKIGTLYYGSTPYSPSSFLGVPARCLGSSNDISSNACLYYGVASTSLNNESSFTALPLVMYQQICIHNYLPSNLLQNNKNFFPDNELHLKLADSASGTTIYQLSYDSTVAQLVPNTTNLADVTLSNISTPVYLDSLRVRQFRGDEFTTAMPFPDLVRGTIPSISFGSGTLSAYIADGTVLAEDVGIYRENGSGNKQFYASNDIGAADSNTDWYLTSNGDELLQAQSHILLDGHNHIVADGNIPVTGSVSFSSSITLSQLRSLAVAQKFAEMMARTDGSYNQMIKAHFNQSPDLHVGKPMYVGGMKQDMVFSEVVQTSESSNNSYQGATNSRGVTAGSGYIGKYHSKDYGYIMSVLSIVPDVYYHQGLEKKWSRISQSDFYFPINNNLSPEALLNKRLYISGTSATDDGLYGYQERDSDYKSRRNRVAGRLVLNAGQSEADNAYVMKRNFTTTPTLSYGFTGMFPSNVDMTVFLTTVDTPFIFNIASRCKAKIPMPYTTVPSDLGIE